MVRCNIEDGLGLRRNGQDYGEKNKDYMRHTSLAKFFTDDLELARTVALYSTLDQSELELDVQSVEEGRSTVVSSPAR